jgi:predicted dehydrogenase
MSVTWFPDVHAPALRGGPVLRWGVLAPGVIAGDFTATVLANTDQRVTAVASRSAERAARFAARHGIDRVYGSYEQLVSDPEVDIVYVAAPHSEHRALSMLAISAGKHVLIEKPIAVSAAEAEEIAATARSAGVLAAEAMWTRYLPQFHVLHQVLERGDLGVVRLATADVGWRMESDAPARFFDPAQGGGAALDMGVYGYWFAQFAVGRPVRIRALGSMTGSGVDDQAVVALAGPGNRHASVTTSMAVTNSGLAAIHGTAGSACFLEPFVFPARFVVTAAGEVHEWRDTSGLTMRAGLAWQASALAQFAAAGMSDSPLHSLDDAISVMRTIDAVRHQLEGAHRTSPGEETTRERKERHD